MLKDESFETTTTRRDSESSMLHTESDISSPGIVYSASKLRGGSFTSCDVFADMNNIQIRANHFAQDFFAPEFWISRELTETHGAAT